MPQPLIPAEWWHTCTNCGATYVQAPGPPHSPTTGTVCGWCQPHPNHETTETTHEWRLRWWIADTLRPYTEIILSGTAGALLIAAATTSPWLAILATALIAITIAHHQI